MIAVLMVRKVKGAILIGILAGTVLAVIIQAIHDQGSQGPPHPDESAGR